MRNIFSYSVSGLFLVSVILSFYVTQGTTFSMVVGGTLYVSALLLGGITIHLDRQERAKRAVSQLQSQIRQVLRETCPVCYKKYAHVGHPLKPGVSMMAICSCRYETTQQGSNTIVVQRPPGDTKPLEERLSEVVQGMRCRICGDKCGSSIAMLSSSGTLEFYPGWCKRHGGDLTRPLTTPVSGPEERGNEDQKGKGTEA